MTLWCEVILFCRLIFGAVGGLSFHGITLEGSCKSDDSHMEQTRGVHREKRGGLTRESRRERERVSGLDREPYTCERLSCIRGGYKSLTDSCAALQFDFTDPQASMLYLHTTKIHALLVCGGSANKREYTIHWYV